MSSSRSGRAGRRARLGWVGLAAAAAGLAAVGATSGAAEARPVRRDVGLTFGGGISLGRTACEIQMCFDARTAGVVDGHVGMMVAPRLALLAEAWGTSSEVGNHTLTRAMAGVGVRFWPRERLWLSASAGVSSTRVSPNLEMVEFNEIVGIAPAGTAAVGYEAFSSTKLALDLHLRTGVALREDRVEAGSTTVGMGVSWY